MSYLGNVLTSFGRSLPASVGSEFRGAAALLYTLKDVTDSRKLKSLKEEIFNVGSEEGGFLDAIKEAGKDFKKQLATGKMTTETSAFSHRGEYNDGSGTSFNTPTHDYFNDSSTSDIPTFGDPNSSSDSSSSSSDFSSMFEESNNQTQDALYTTSEAIIGSNLKGTSFLTSAIRDNSKVTAAAGAKTAQITAILATTMGTTLNSINFIATAHYKDSAKYYAASLQTLMNIEKYTQSPYKHYNGILEAEHTRLNNSYSDGRIIKDGQSFVDFGVNVIKKGFEELNQSMVAIALSTGQGIVDIVSSQLISTLDQKMLYSGNKMYNWLKDADLLPAKFISNMQSKMMDMDRFGLFTGFLRRALDVHGNLDKNEEYNVQVGQHLKQGVTQFDLETKTAIVEVIPTYLAQILSTLQYGKSDSSIRKIGDSAMVRDPLTGTWVSNAKLKERVERDTASMAMSNFSRGDFSNVLTDIVGKNASTEKERNEGIQAMLRFANKAAVEGYKVEDIAKLGLVGSDNKNYKHLMAYMNWLSTASEVDKAIFTKGVLATPSAVEQSRKRLLDSDQYNTAGNRQAFFGSNPYDDTFYSGNGGNILGLLQGKYSDLDINSIIENTDGGKKKKGKKGGISDILGGSVNDVSKKISVIQEIGKRDKRDAIELIHHSLKSTMDQHSETQLLNLREEMLGGNGNLTIDDFKNKYGYDANTGKIDIKSLDKHTSKQLATMGVSKKVRDLYSNYLKPVVDTILAPIHKFYDNIVTPFLDTVKEKVSYVWDKITGTIKSLYEETLKPFVERAKETATGFYHIGKEKIRQFLFGDKDKDSKEKGIFGGIKESFNSVLESSKKFLSSTWNSIATKVREKLWKPIVASLTDPEKGIVGTEFKEAFNKGFLNSIKVFFMGDDENGIKNIFSRSWDMLDKHVLSKLFVSDDSDSTFTQSIKDSISKHLIEPIGNFLTGGEDETGYNLLGKVSNFVSEKMFKPLTEFLVGKDGKSGMFGWINDKVISPVKDFLIGNKEKGVMGVLTEVVETFKHSILNPTIKALYDSDNKSGIFYDVKRFLFGDEATSKNGILSSMWEMANKHLLSPIYNIVEKRWQEFSEYMVDHVFSPMKQYLSGLMQSSVNMLTRVVVRGWDIFDNALGKAFGATGTFSQLLIKYVTTPLIHVADKISQMALGVGKIMLGATVGLFGFIADKIKISDLLKGTGGHLSEEERERLRQKFNKFRSDGHKINSWGEQQNKSFLQGFSNVFSDTLEKREKKKAAKDKAKNEAKEASEARTNQPVNIKRIKDGIITLVDTALAQKAVADNALKEDRKQTGLLHAVKNMLQNKFGKDSLKDNKEKRKEITYVSPEEIELKKHTKFLKDIKEQTEHSLIRDATIMGVGLTKLDATNGYLHDIRNYVKSIALKMKINNLIDNDFKDEGILNRMMRMVMEPLEIFSKKMAKILNNTMDLLAAVPEKIGSFFESAWTGLGKFFSGGWKTLGDVWTTITESNMVKGFLKGVSSFLGGIGDALTTAMNTISEKFEGFGDALGRLLGKTILGATYVVGNVVKGLVLGGLGLLGFAASTVKNLGGAMLEGVMWKPLKKAFSTVFKPFSKLFMKPQRVTVVGGKLDFLPPVIIDGFSHNLGPNNKDVMKVFVVNDVIHTKEYTGRGSNNPYGLKNSKLGSRSYDFKPSTIQEAGHYDKEGNPVPMPVKVIPDDPKHQSKSYLGRVGDIFARKQKQDFFDREGHNEGIFGTVAKYAALPALFLLARRIPVIGNLLDNILPGARAGGNRGAFEMSRDTMKNPMLAKGAATLMRNITLKGLLPLALTMGTSFYLSRTIMDIAESGINGLAGMFGVENFKLEDMLFFLPEEMRGTVMTIATTLAGGVLVDGLLEKFIEPSLKGVFDKTTKGTFKDKILMRGKFAKNKEKRKLGKVIRDRAHLYKSGLGTLGSIGGWAAGGITKWIGRKTIGEDLTGSISDGLANAKDFVKDKALDFRDGFKDKKSNTIMDSILDLAVDDQVGLPKATANESSIPMLDDIATALHEDDRKYIEAENNATKPKKGFFKRAGQKFRIGKKKLGRFFGRSMESPNFDEEYDDEVATDTPKRHPRSFNGNSFVGDVAKDSADVMDSPFKSMIKDFAIDYASRELHSSLLGGETASGMIAKNLFGSEMSPEMQSFASEIESQLISNGLQKIPSMLTNGSLKGLAQGAGDFISGNMMDLKKSKLLQGLGSATSRITGGLADFGGNLLGRGGVGASGGGIMSKVATWGGRLLKLGRFIPMLITPVGLGVTAGVIGMGWLLGKLGLNIEYGTIMDSFGSLMDGDFSGFFQGITSSFSVDKDSFLAKAVDMFKGFRLPSILDIFKAVTYSAMNIGTKLTTMMPGISYEDIEPSLIEANPFSENFGKTRAEIGMETASTTSGDSKSYSKSGIQNKAVAQAYGAPPEDPKKGFTNIVADKVVQFWNAVSPATAKAYEFGNSIGRNIAESVPDIGRKIFGNMFGGSETENNIAATGGVSTSGGIMNASVYGPTIPEGQGEFASTGFAISTGNTSYDELAVKYGKEFGVDPELVKAMINQESSGNANAVSNKGAAGLMQLMGATADEVAGKLGIHGADRFDPAQNIRMGTYYIAEKLREFKGDPNLALAAYNAGAGAVRKHGGIPPFTETQNYVRKIMGKYSKTRRTVGAGAGNTAAYKAAGLSSVSLKGISGGGDPLKASYDRAGANMDRLNPQFRTRLLSMIAEYNAKTGKTPRINSAFRTYAEQVALYKKYGPGRAAKPGTSRHESGLAVDISRHWANEMNQLGLFKKYGLVRPIAKKEPWHIEPAEARGIAFDGGSLGASDLDSNGAAGTSLVKTVANSVQTSPTMSKVDGNLDTESSASSVSPTTSVVDKLLGKEPPKTSSSVSGSFYDYGQPTEAKKTVDSAAGAFYDYGQPKTESPKVDSSLVNSSPAISSESVMNTAMLSDSYSSSMQANAAASAASSATKEAVSYTNTKYSEAMSARNISNSQASSVPYTNNPEINKMIDVLREIAANTSSTAKNTENMSAVNSEVSNKNSTIQNFMNEVNPNVAFLGMNPMKKNTNVNWQNASTIASGV